MAKIIEAEHSDSDNGDSKPRTSRKRRSKPKKTTKIINDSDPGDENFSASSKKEGESSDESENDSDVIEITNEEVSES
jgi:hypothetical protein